MPLWDTLRERVRHFDGTETDTQAWSHRNALARLPEQSLPAQADKQGASSSRNGMAILATAISLTLVLIS